jgi:AcrR family transcriptional regulator
MARSDGGRLRADAQRNRDKILTTAVRLFAERGLDVNFDVIAAEAGVGSGTLYRNFPSRDALIEAAYRNELARLCESAPDLLSESPPAAALREWMSRFLDYARAKLGMADALRAVMDSGGTPYCDTRRMMLEAIGTLLDAGRASGEISADVDASDMLAAVTGIALSVGKPDQREQAERLIALTVAGLTATQ